MNKKKLLLTFTLPLILTSLLMMVALRVTNSFYKTQKISLTPLLLSANNINKALENHSFDNNINQDKDSKNIIALINKVDRSLDKKIRLLKRSSYKKRVSRIAYKSNKVNSKLKSFNIPSSTIIKTSYTKKFSYKDINKPRNKKHTYGKYKIKNNQLVEHYGFNVNSKIELIAFNKIKLPFPLKVPSKEKIALANQEVDTVTDEVKEIASTSIRNNLKLSIEQSELVKNFKNDEELVAFDYSKNKTHEKEKISHTVLSSMKRIMASHNKKLSVKSGGVGQKKQKKSEYSKLLEEIRSNRPPVQAVVDTRSSVTNSPTRNSILNSLYGSNDTDYSESDKVGKVVVSANLIEIDSKSKVSEPISEFEFIPYYDSNKRYYDNAEGVITIEEKLNGDLSIMSGSIVKRGVITTNITLPVEEGALEFNVPLFSQSEFAGFLDKENMNVPGGFLLIELNDEIESVDISSNYEGRVYLDAEFKVIPVEGDIAYILFVGIKPGNSLVSYYTSDNKISEKILYIRDNELQFEKPIMIQSGFENLEVKESRLLGKVDFELNIDGSNISFFNKSIHAKNIGINSYKIQNPVLSLGMRKYYEFKHLDNSIFVGRWEHKAVEIPGSDYIDYIFDAFEIENLQSQCMIQINLNRDAIEFSTNGESFNGPMNLSVKYLDKDGLFNDEITPFAKKVFVVGEYEGVINFKVSYQDGSTDVVRSICSDSSYLVEQL